MDPAGDEDDKALPPERLAQLDQLRFEGVSIGSEPVWQDRVREIFRQLDPEIASEVADRLVDALGEELVDFGVFSERYGLTAAEELLVRAVADGLSVPEHAEKRGISVNTARVHMQRVLEKTGARRQTDLVRMLFRR
ncbi:helix-turn-helix domain-containing protein [Qipengyuania flava]|uniref:helix-turn-helix domain-containing protein n=1 Tax=Qipengyuania flava TaxID=192812 RepID=UPI001C62ED11|nr:helix-turn-helix transcriptional regulator [Qipengyuania flava]QYJ07529.1 helix-turn-helix transcriptional regulator [Qipengyuania flava]